MMSFLGELVVSVLILIGTFFLLVGSIGLAKLPDMMRRLHGPTKATTLGIGAMLIASMVYATLYEGGLSLHELLITIFLFLTAPVTAFMIAKAHILRDRPTQASLPPTHAGAGWATFHRAPHHRRRSPAAEATD
ncbi:MAG TPA: Na+/H+ antiporter subunit G [Arenibaculum sp.]|nr:Na+/H+ antiporter subunit G [Arenibaculum sp.]